MVSQGPPQTPAGRARAGLNPRVALALVVILVIAGGVALLTQGGGGKSAPAAGVVHTVPSASFRGAVASPPALAPALALHNYLGAPVNIAQYRGKAVLVTFLYTHCPDVCPLIAANLHVAQTLMGPAESAKVQIITVSVDPRGDTPKAIAGFLARHQMTGHMQYLVGSAPELAKVWSAWNVGSEKDAQQPELVNHTGLVYGISASGKITTLYAANFKPSDIAHDVPLLASE
ncbi:MAG TPA: SCO family protein [Solirubrobacteraceae bacterium]|jgi:protein SCO1/2